MVWLSGMSTAANSRQKDIGEKKRETGARVDDGGTDRKHLTERQLEQLIRATKPSRNEPEPNAALAELLFVSLRYRGRMPLQVAAFTIVFATSPAGVTHNYPKAGCWK